MESSDATADDIISLLRKRCRDLDVSKEKDATSTVVRFPLLERNDYYFRIVVDQSDVTYSALYFQAMRSHSAEEKSIPLLWHRGEDELYSDSYEETLASLVDEVFETLSHRSKIVVKNGLLFRSSQLYVEMDGRWRGVRLGRMIGIRWPNVPRYAEFHSAPVLNN